MSNSEYIDGPKLAAWLETHFPETVASAIRASGTSSGKGYGDSFGRALQRWRSGSHPSIVSVDNHLISRGLHISLIPDEFYLEGNQRGPTPSMARQQAIALFDAGYTAGEVADRVDATFETVKSWRKAFGKRRVPA